MTWQYWDEDPSQPESCYSLATSQETGEIDQADSLPTRISRYSRAKQHALGMLNYLSTLSDDRAESALARLLTCGNYLHFRHYFTESEVRLHSASFCKQHLICPLCAIRRGVRSLTAYLERYRYLIAHAPELSPYLITFTVRDGDDLSERFSHLTESFKRLQIHRRHWLSGGKRAKYTEWSRVSGGVGSYELKRGANSGLWHPHVHLATLCAVAPDQQALRAEWEAITGDSFMVDVRPFTPDQDEAQAFMEVMKYAVKFSDLSYPDNWHVAQELRNRRLLFSFGCFRGVKVPQELTDEPLENLPYLDLFYRYFSDSGYTITGELPPR